MLVGASNDSLKVLKNRPIVIRKIPVVDVPKEDRWCLRNGYLNEKYLNYLGHCVKRSNLEYYVDRLTESLAGALTTVVNVLT